MPGTATESVRVVVRVRPLNHHELARGNVSILDVDRSCSQVSLYSNRSIPPKQFAFDAVYGPDTEQQLIYDETAFPLIENVLEGYNGTIFAYGQTGCGKTFTMSGSSEQPGIIPNSFKHIFSAISDTGADRMFLVYCSFVEIYNEEIRDLLKYDPKTKLELKEKQGSGVFIKNLKKESVNTISDILRLMDIGASHRTTKETAMNERSSRSHSIFTVYVEMSETREDGAHFKAGKLNLVDLAGSERQKKTHAEGDRLKEAIEINLSLSALGNVISALVDGHSSHIPYRDSKLTRLLQDSLGGNTKTIMIAVASPADYNYDESLSTLRYASRAKFIQNRPTVNEDPKDALLREYMETINRLRKELQDQQVEVKYVEKIVYVEEDDMNSSRDFAPKVVIRQEEPGKTGKMKGKSGKKEEKGMKKRGVKGELEEDSEGEENGRKRKETERKKGEKGKKQVELEDDSDSFTPEEVKSFPKPSSSKPPSTHLQVDSDSDSPLSPSKPPIPIKPLQSKAKPAKPVPKPQPVLDKRAPGSKSQLALPAEEEYSDDFGTEEPAKTVSKGLNPGNNRENKEQRRKKQAGGANLKTLGGEKAASRPQVSADVRREHWELEDDSGSERYQDDFELEQTREMRKKAGEEEYGEDFEPEEGEIRPSESVKSLKKRGEKKKTTTEQHKPPVPSKRPVGDSLRASKVVARGLDSSSASEGEKQDDPERKALLAMIKQKVVRGGQAQEHRGEMERLKERRRKLLMQQQQSQPKTRTDADEQLFKEVKYENLQDEAENQRKLLQVLDMKVKGAMAEIADLNHEHEAEKEDLLSTVRVKERESGLLYRILEKVISPEQLNLIKQKSKFDDDNNTWKVPPFLLQPNKPLTFPKLPRRQAQELVETELMSKTLRFPENPEIQMTLEGRRRGVSQPGIEDRPRGGFDEFPMGMKRSYIS